MEEGGGDQVDDRHEQDQDHQRGQGQNRSEFGSLGRLKVTSIRLNLYTVYCRAGRLRFADLQCRMKSYIQANCTIKINKNINFWASLLTERIPRPADIK